jgi:hypothetical protein
MARNSLSPLGVVDSGGSALFYRHRGRACEGHCSALTRKVSTMKNLAIAATTVGTLVVTALGMPGAATAAPSGPSPVDDTVANLQAEGYKVIVTRLSGAESSNCSVYAIRPGQQVTQETPTGGRGNHARQVVSNTVYVDVRC